MINKIKKTFKKNKLWYILYIIFILIFMYFIALKFQYLITTNYFLFNKNDINKDIIIVAIDKATITSKLFTRYQDIHRSDYATIIRNIQYWEPKVIWVDVFFLQQSNNEINDRELIKELKEDENIVIAYEVWESWQIWTSFMWQDYKWYWYVDILAHNRLDIFWLNLTDYKNNIPIHFEWDNPSLPFVLNIYKIINWYKNTQINFWKQEINFDNWKSIIPIQKNGESYTLNTNYFTNNYQKVSFIDVYNNTIDSSIFKDKIVLIWATASDIHDEFFTPYKTSDYMPWVEIHANTLNTIMSWKYISYQWFLSFLIVNFVLLCLFFFIILLSKRIVYWILLSICILSLFIIISIWLFNYGGIFVEIFPTIIWFLILNSIIFFDKFFEELKNKNQIKNVFSKYVSQDVVEQLISMWTDNLRLWWVERTVTIFFSDLVWFTDLSEKLTVEQLWNILNIYFENMSNIILSKKWTIDKFMWDAIMAFWNAPLEVDFHENLACETALLQRQSLQIIREEIQKYWVQVHIDMRIWINTWNVVVWNFGCSKRYDYTILWDSVNLWSRLEWINKQYDTKIMISEYTYQNIDKNRFVTREIDLITVKWKEQPVRIYELVWFVWQVSQEILENIKWFSKWLALYRTRKFKEAYEIFNSLNDPVAKIFMGRCDEFLKTPPEDKWDNVFRFKVK